DRAGIDAEGLIQLDERPVEVALGLVGAREAEMDAGELLGTAPREGGDDLLERRGGVLAATGCAVGIAEQQQEVAIVGGQLARLFEERNRRGRITALRQVELGGATVERDLLRDGLRLLGVFREELGEV